MPSINIVGLDNKKYTINSNKYVRKSKNASNLHKEARKLIKELFPAFVLLEEVVLPGSKMNGMKNLSADFIILDCRTVVEVHGRQHYEYIEHFHKSKAGFYRHKKRDKMKKEWCALNGFNFIELKYDEDIDEWKQRITHSICE